MFNNVSNPRKTLSTYINIQWGFTSPYITNQFGKCFNLKLSQLHKTKDYCWSCLWWHHFQIPIQFLWNIKAHTNLSIFTWAIWTNPIFIIGSNESPVSPFYDTQQVTRPHRPKTASTKNIPSATQETPTKPAHQISPHLPCCSLPCVKTLPLLLLIVLLQGSGCPAFAPA